MLNSFLGSMKRRYPDLIYQWVKHRAEAGQHLHLLAFTTHEVEPEFIFRKWAGIMNKYGTSPYRPRDAFCKERDCPGAVLAYVLGINKNYPRATRPWGDLGGRVCDGTLGRSGWRKSK
jgi:hypothetical protein